jgi:UDP-glucuronate decarboxylase
MKNILVAGGAGFIGSHLCECLLHQGHQIICLDNFRTGSLKNVSPLMNNPCFKLVEHDITMPYKIQGIDEIYNLACPASPVHYQVSPVETVKTSFIGTLNLLELAHDNQCKLLQASTSEVYGDPEIHPQPEHYWGHVNPNGIRSCYDEGKRCAESLCMDFYREYGVEVKIIRIFNTYGPRMACDDGRVVSNFILQALRGKDLTVYGNGMQTRSFQYIDDLIRVIESMMSSRNTFTGPVNIGNPEEYTVLGLARLIIELTGSRSVIRFSDIPSDDPRRRNPDITLARQALHWQPRVSLYEGLQKTIAYYRRLLSVCYEPVVCQ